MELWIRSQDKKEIIKANEISINSEIINCKETGKFFVDVNDYCFGTYKTKERALEVLDEIQKKLMPISEYKQEVDNLIINYKNIDTCVYEMPKE